MTPREILALIREKEVRAVDLRFMDFPGLWQHFTIPAEMLDEHVFEEGLGIDGSSIRGWQAINESDMLVVPAPDTAFLDPFARDRTLTMICNIQDPLTKEDYTRDPRNVARKAVNWMKSGGIADAAQFGPEVEFFLFDDVRYDQTANSGYYFLDSAEGAWNTGRDERPNLGYKLRHREGYFPTPPADAMHDLRSEMMLQMIECGLKVEGHHHESASGGQGEIDIRHAPLVETADNVLKYKYIVKNVARKHGKTATFMPKPIFGDNGNGM
ncbi:MAG: glutamine synthetase beta-grasp domain-containing protein, partial [Gemmataceae bacterium]|nr:glutamine synthetase beta-grasp domain-containing protein [Gemmataceae bacterium]